MNKRLYISFLVLVSLAFEVSAHSFLWDVDFYGFFDNREYNYRNQKSQTLFATRLSPEVGLALTPSADVSHALMAGLSWIQPIGADWKAGNVLPTLYYRYAMPRFQTLFGMFPRTQLEEPLPAVLCYDSLTCFRPNITGALFRYSGDKGYVELTTDWRQARTRSQREAFDVVVSGRWQPGVFWAGGHFVLNHLSRSWKPQPGQSVMDDIILYPYIGVDVARYTPLDVLSLKCGYLLSLERDRNVGKWHSPQGFLCDIRGEWRWLGLSNTLYAGEGQMPFYGALGSQLNQGDPFYQSRFYDRLDVYAHIFRTHFVNFKASFNLHFTPGEVSWQQQLSVRFYLDDEIWKNRRNREYKRAKLKDIL